MATKKTKQAVARTCTTCVHARETERMDGKKIIKCPFRPYSIFAPDSVQDCITHREK